MIALGILLLVVALLLLSGSIRSVRSAIKLFASPATQELMSGVMQWKRDEAAKAIMRSTTGTLIANLFCIAVVVVSAVALFRAAS